MQFAFADKDQYFQTRCFTLVLLTSTSSLGCFLFCTQKSYPSRKDQFSPLCPWLCSLLLIPLLLQASALGSFSVLDTE